MRIDYNDINLHKLIEDLQPKRRLQALRGAYRKGGRMLRNAVIRELRNSLHSSKDLEKGVRALLTKKKAGFRATVGTKMANKKGKGEAGFHTNRQGQKKPVLVWADKGTKERRTKRGKSTGRMRHYGLMQNASNAVKDSVSEEISTSIITELVRVSRKYGCN